MKTYMRGDTLTFKGGQFSGGRLGGENEIIEIEFMRSEEGDAIDIALMDVLNNKDGHYSPVRLSFTQAYVLKQWLERQILKQEQQK